MVHYICKYTPIEIFYGFGEQCEALDIIPDNFDLSDNVAHPNLCGFGKTIIQACMSGKVEELVLVNCCDAIKRSYDVIKNSNMCKFIYMMDLPHDNNGCAKEMMVSEIEKLCDVYGKYKGKKFDTEKFVKAFYEKEDIKEEYIGIIGARVGKKMEGFIQESINMPVRNCTCTENRKVLLTKNIKTEDFKSQMMAYSQEILGQMPCQRMHDNTARRALFEDPKLKGIIYHTVKFCDFYSFEYMDVKNSCSVPLLKIETDCTLQSKGQMSTRLEAFAESITGIEKGGNDCMMNDKKYVVGIDSGSTSTDVVIMDKDRKIIATAIVPTGAGASAGAEKALEIAMENGKIKREDIGKVVTTGYGRSYIKNGDKSITEITCHAKGANFLNPKVRTIIDIGGQDSKVIRVDNNGDVKNFVMNDKCAAGTGRFLEAMARTLDMTLDEISKMGIEWKENIVISSMCTVFAESEVVSLRAQDKSVSDIVHGLNDSVAAKTYSLMSRLGFEGEYMMTGGVARNLGVVKAIENRLGEKIFTSESSQICGAIGAALFALV